MLALLWLPLEAFAAEEAPEPRRIFGTLGNTFLSEYTLQGFVIEKKGVIAQPYGRLTLSILDELDVFGGFYLSLHDAHTDAGSADPSGTPKRLRAFYEADWFAGAALHHDRWSLTAMYWEILGPSDAFETAQAVEMIFAYADKGLIAEDLAVNPYVDVYVETNGKSGTGVDEGTYLQVGVKPTTTRTELGHPFTVMLPISVGFGFDEFFAGDELYGHTTIALLLTAPLAPLIPESYGVWSVTPGFTYAHLNEDVQFVRAGSNRTFWSVTTNVDF